MRNADQCRTFVRPNAAYALTKRPRRRGSGEDVDGGTDVRPVPGEARFVVGNAQTAMRPGIAPVARPVVVVNAGAVVGEVLRPEHVFQVVAARRIAWDGRVDPFAG